MHSKRRLLAFSSGLLAAILATAPVLASNFSPPYAEGRTHTVSHVSLTQAWIDASQYARAHLTIVTDMSASLVTYHDADVAMYDQNDGDAGYYGYSQCVTFASSTVCSHWHVVFNQFYPTNVDKRKSIACHEVGHTVGLKDYNVYSSCMHDDEFFPLTYSSHDISHINGKY